MNRYLLSIAILMTMLACESSQRDATHELQTVKNILAREREAHLKKDVSLLLSNSIDTVWDVSHGLVRPMTSEQSKQRFTNYFNTVEFLKWDDAAEPVFVFSADSSMAVVIVQKQVITTTPPDTKSDTTDYAWTAIYKKIDEQWKMVSITSTNK